MTKESQSPTGTGSPRGVRLALVSSGVAFVALIGVWAVLQIIPMVQQGHTLGGLLLAIAALLILSLAGRVIAVNWRALDAPRRPPGAPADGNDQTGIWGVGGPSMREPGSTGVWQVRNVDRRYEDSDD